MTTTASSIELLNRLVAIRRLRPELRFGQLVAIIGQLAEDETGRNLWDGEDGEFAAATERLATDLLRGEQTPAEPGAVVERPCE
jgi:hypothetical protein